MLTSAFRSDALARDLADSTEVKLSSLFRYRRAPAEMAHSSGKICDTHTPPYMFGYDPIQRSPEDNPPASSSSSSFSSCSGSAIADNSVVHQSDTAACLRLFIESVYFARNVSIHKRKMMFENAYKGDGPITEIAHFLGPPALVRPIQAEFSGPWTPETLIQDPSSPWSGIVDYEMNEFGGDYMFPPGTSTGYTNPAPLVNDGQYVFTKQIPASTMLRTRPRSEPLFQFNAIIHGLVSKVFIYDIMHGRHPELYEDTDRLSSVCRGRAIVEYSEKASVEHRVVVKFYPCSITEPAPELTNEMYTLFSPHPKLTSVLGCGIYPSPCIVQEDHGFPLSDFHLDEPKFRTIWRDVLIALGDLHRKGIVHRDVKQQNIFVDVNLNARLGDLETLLCYKPSFKEEEDSCGRRKHIFWGGRTTYTALAPEYIMGDVSADPAKDMWAAGIAMVNSIYNMQATYRQNFGEILRTHMILFGSPDALTLGEFAKLPGFKYYSGYVLRQRYRAMIRSSSISQRFWKDTPGKKKDQLVDLLKRVCDFNASRRLTATKALSHPYFQDVD